MHEDHIAGRLASRWSHVVITPPATPRGDLLAAGRSDAEIRADLHAGRLVRMAPGFYVEAGGLKDLSSDDRELVRIRATARRSPGLVISHRSAAALHGLPLLASRSNPVHLIRPGDGGARRTRDRHVHVAGLADQERTTIDGIAVTTVARTLFDLGRTESVQQALVPADAALHHALVDTAALAVVLAAHPSVVGRPRAIRALRLADGRSESPGETLTRLALQTPGMPALELQPEIRDEYGAFVGRTDFGIPECGVLVEFDGHTKYTALLRPGQSINDVVLAEKRREERLTELGWLVVRVIWADLANGEALVRRLLRACTARRRLVATFGLRGSLRPTLPITF